MTRFGDSLRRRPWSLQRKLVAAMTTVMAVVLLVVGVVCVVTLHASVTTVVDKQLASSMAAFSHSVDKYRDVTPGVGPNDEKPLTGFGGQAPGTVIMLLNDGVVTDSAMFSDSEPAPLNAEAIRQIEGRDWVDGERQNLDVAGLGHMRMQSVAHDEVQTNRLLP